MSDFIIGLTGGIGSGKTTVTNFFADLNVDIVDADIIAREVVAVGSPALVSIKNQFGAEYLLKDGSLNRPLLRQRIFSDEQDKAWLNNLLHPLIREQLILQTKSAKSDYCILVAPLLIENNLHKMVNRVLVVDISEEQQIARTTKRDKNSVKQVKVIIASQASREARLAVADDVINNDEESLGNVQKLIFQLHQQYLEFTSNQTADNASKLEK